MGATPHPHRDECTMRRPGRPPDAPLAPDAHQTPWPRRQSRPIILVMQADPTRQHSPTIGPSDRPRTRPGQQRRPRERSKVTRAAAGPQRSAVAPLSSFNPWALDPYSPLVCPAHARAAARSHPLSLDPYSPIPADPDHSRSRLPVLTAVSRGVPEATPPATCEGQEL
jgi:hypothetical protein